MNKLFRLKKWLTVADAARHLTIVFGEDVTEADVLRLALDEKLRLSIFLADEYVYAKRVHKVPIPEFLTTNSENSIFVSNVDSLLSVEDDKIFRLSGVLDLPMIDLDRMEIENEYRRLTSEMEVGDFGGGKFYIEASGQLYALHDPQPPPWHIKIDPPGGVEQFMRQSALTHYSASQEIPGHSIIVVRTEALRNLEASLYSTSGSTDNRMVTTTHAHVSDKLAILNQAAERFWANANREDRGTHPKNDDVAAWLTQRGYSVSLAHKAVSIIRPEWVPTGRKPEE